MTIYPYFSIWFFLFFLFFNFLLSSLSSPIMLSIASIAAGIWLVKWTDSHQFEWLMSFVKCANYCESCSLTQPRAGFALSEMVGSRREGFALLPMGATDGYCLNFSWWADKLLRKVPLRVIQSTNTKRVSWQYKSWLSVTVSPWQLIPDCYFQDISSVTVYGTFPNEIYHHGKTYLG